MRAVVRVGERGVGDAGSSASPADAAAVQTCTTAAGLASARAARIASGQGAALLSGQTGARQLRRTPARSAAAAKEAVRRVGASITVARTTAARRRPAHTARLVDQIRPRCNTPERYRRRARRLFAPSAPVTAAQGLVRSDRANTTRWPVGRHWLIWQRITEVDVVHDGGGRSHWRALTHPGAPLRLQRSRRPLPP